MLIRKKWIILSSFLVFCSIFIYVIVNNEKPLEDAKPSVVALNADGTTDVIEPIQTVHTDKELEIVNLLEEKEYIEEAMLALLYSESDDSKLIFYLVLHGHGVELQEQIDEILLTITSNVENVDIQNSCISDTSGNYIFLGENFSDGE